MNSKKLIAGVVALAMAAAIVPSAGQAATAEELAAQIAQLQAQLASLMGQLGDTTGTVSSTAPAACAGVSFTRNLTLGSQGTDVQCLQSMLNQDVETQVAATGVGSTGFETQYFGGLTKSAVIAFQNKYAAEVLAPVGLTAGTGFVGASTRAKLNAMLVSTTGTTGTTGETGTTGTTGTTLPEGCTSTTGYSPTTGEPCSAGTTSTGTGLTMTGQEGAITVSVNPTPANNVKVYEGDEKIAVYGAKIQATGSDVDVQRVTLKFNAQAWSYLTNVYLYDGDTQIASSALNSSTVSRVSATDYQITLAGFTSKVIVANGASKALIVKVDALPGLSSSLVDASIEVSLPSTTAIRAIDQAGLNQYGGVTTERTFTMNASLAADATLAVSSNANSPKSRNVIADASQIIDKATLLTFDMKATKDNVLLDQINDVTFTTDDSGTYQVPDTIYLVDDAGTVISTATPTACATAASDCSNIGAGTADFTDLNYTIAKDTTKTFSLKIDDTLTAPTASVAAEDGRKYVVTVASGANIVATLSNGATLATAKKTGSAASEAAYVYAEGPVFTLASVSTTSSQASYATASSTISATFNIQVAAITGDVWIPDNDAFAIGYGVDGKNTGTISSITYVRPTGTVDGTQGYKVAAGNTATFAVSGTTTGSAATYDLRINSIKWGHADIAYNNAAIVTSAYMLDDSNWISNAVYLQ